MMRITANLLIAICFAGCHGDSPGRLGASKCQRDPESCPFASNSLLDPHNAPETFVSGDASVTPEAGTRGLKNLGNTCYWNSMMQVLLHSEGLRAAVSEMGAARNSLLRAVSWIFAEEYAGNPSAAIDPRPLYQEFSKLNPELFAIGVQQDPQEAFGSAYNFIMRAVSAERPELLSYFNLFEFEYVREIFCTDRLTKVASSSTALERELLLPLPRGERADLVTQLHQYFSPEHHSGLETCSGTEARIATRMASAPELLVFLVHRNEYGKPKNRIAIEFPLILDTLPGQASVVYRLIGIVHHHGKSPHSGHYTAEFRHPTSGNWYNADDSRVEPIEGGAPSQSSRTAYLFLYEKLH